METPNGWMEGTLQIGLFQLCRAGDLPPKQPARGPFQPALTHLRGWGTHSFSGHKGLVGQEISSNRFQVFYIKGQVDVLESL